ncbi:hypothetical protein VTK73DRAFT_4756 [Phialemonium thermophilum]|uniref:Uncharacterized protein n=1 Tax=Phialemonium thermophilum TaxID=223376 RepID=A0ABR3V638_9PEZI
MAFTAELPPTSLPASTGTVWLCRCAWGTDMMLYRNRGEKPPKPPCTCSMRGESTARSSRQYSARVDQHRRLAVLRESIRQGQPGRAAADDDVVVGLVQVLGAADDAKGGRARMGVRMSERARDGQGPSQ